MLLLLNPIDSYRWHPGMSRTQSRLTMRGSVLSQTVSLPFILTKEGTCFTALRPLWSIQLHELDEREGRGTQLTIPGEELGTCLSVSGTDGEEVLLRHNPGHWLHIPRITQMWQLNQGKATLEHLKIPGLCDYGSRRYHSPQNDRSKIISNVLKHLSSILDYHELSWTLTIQPLKLSIQLNIRESSGPGGGGAHL